MRSDEVRRVVSQIDETRQTEQFRNPDRPDGSIVPRRRKRVSPEIVRAQSRLRAAAWRNEQDARGAPTTAQIGMALVVALVRTIDPESISAEDRGIVGAMLTDLRNRGFDLKETVTVLKRMRTRIRAADSEAETSPGHGV